MGSSKDVPTQDCSEGDRCPLLSELTMKGKDHRSLYRHPCRSGLECPKLRSTRHCLKYTHTKPTAREDAFPDYWDPFPTCSNHVEIPVDANPKCVHTKRRLEIGALLCP